MKRMFVLVISLCLATQLSYAASNLDPEIAICKDQLRNNTDNVELLMKLAHLYLQNGDYSEGERYLKTAREVAPDNPQIYFSLATTYMLNGNITALSGTLQAASALNLSEDGWFQLANFYYLIKEFVSAQVIATKLVENYPASARFHALLSQCLKNTGNIPQAIAEIKRTLELSQKPEYHFDLANLYMLQNREDEARKEYLDYAGGKSFVLVRIADDLQTKGLLNEAMDRYLSAYQLNPQNIQALISAAALAKKMKQTEKAKALLECAAQQNTNKSEEWLSLAYLYKDMKDFPKALMCVENSLRVQPTTAAYMAQGYIYKDSKEVSKAVQSFEKALELEPKNYQAYLALAWVYKDRGYLDKAYQYGVMALAVTPRIQDCEALFENINNNNGYELTENIRIGAVSEFQQTLEGTEYKVYERHLADLLTGSHVKPIAELKQISCVNNFVQGTFDFVDIPLVRLAYTNTKFIDHGFAGLPTYNHMVNHIADIKIQERFDRETYGWDSAVTLGYSRVFNRNPDNDWQYNEDKNIYSLVFQTEPLFRQFNMCGIFNYQTGMSPYNQYTQIGGHFECRNNFDALRSSFSYGLDVFKIQYDGVVNNRLRQDYFITGFWPVVSSVTAFTRLEAILVRGVETVGEDSLPVYTHTYQCSQEVYLPVYTHLILVPWGSYEWGAELSEYNNWVAGAELRYYMKIANDHSVAEKTVSWKENISLVLGFKNTQYNQLDLDYQHIYARIYFFL